MRILLIIFFNLPNYWFFICWVFLTNKFLNNVKHDNQNFTNIVYLYISKDRSLKSILKYSSKNEI